MSTETLKLYNSDFCPFGQRAWIAAIELGIPFKTQHVNFLDKGREDTKEFLAVSPSGTVPAGIYKGNEVYDSLNMIEYLQNAFGGDVKLFPEDPYEGFKARAMLEKHGKYVGAFYQFLMAQGDDIPAKKEAYVACLKALNEDIVGPYFMGKDFTILDVAFIPFNERAEILLPHYKNFETPSELTNFLKWVETVKQRESYKVSAADRVKGSIEALPEDWAHITDRTEYIRTVYAGYASGEGPGKFRKAYQERMNEKRANAKK